VKTVSAFRWFMRDVRGAAAMEFALVAPMMAIALLASVDIVDMMQANQRVENTAASISDVVSRDILLTDRELDDIWSAAGPLLRPTPSGDAKMRVSAAMIVNATQAKVIWSDGNGLGAYRANTLVTIPASVGQVQTGLIIVDTQVRYASPLGILGGSGVTLRRTEYRRPRIVDPVAREGVTYP